MDKPESSHSSRMAGIINSCSGVSFSIFICLSSTLPYKFIYLSQCVLKLTINLLERIGKDNKVRL